MKKKIVYNGWEIWEDTFCWVGIHMKNHDESGDWQVHGDSVEEVKFWIDEKEDCH